MTTRHRAGIASAVAVLAMATPAPAAALLRVDAFGAKGSAPGRSMGAALVPSHNSGGRFSAKYSGASQAESLKFTEHVLKPADPQVCERCAQRDAEGLLGPDVRHREAQLAGARSG